MKKTEKTSLEEHKRFMDDEVQPYLKPLMIDLLKKRPKNVLEFIIEWCQTKGPQIKKIEPVSTKVAEVVPEKFEEQAHKNLRESIHEITETHAHLPSSDEEDETDYLPEETEEQKLNNDHRLSTQKKKLAISAEADVGIDQKNDFIAPVIEKSPEQEEQIKKTLELNFMFKTLDESDQEVILQAMGIKEYAEGDFVIKQGEDGSELFIVGSGSLRCTQKTENSEQEIELKIYQKGDVFGELALMYNAPRAATISAIEASVCYSLDRETFNRIVKTSAVRKRAKFEEFLGKVELLSDLKPYERSKICDCLQLEKFSKDEIIIREGEDGQRFYFIQSGTAEAFTKNSQGEETRVFEYNPSDYFGELALLNGEKRKATIKVTSQKMTLLSLDANSFNRLLGPLDKILQRNAVKYQKYVQQAQ